MIIRSFRQEIIDRPDKFLFSYVETGTMIMKHQHRRTFQSLRSTIRNKQVRLDAFFLIFTSAYRKLHIPALISLTLLSCKHLHFRTADPADLRHIGPPIRTRIPGKKKKENRYEKKSNHVVRLNGDTESM